MSSTSRTSVVLFAIISLAISAMTLDSSLTERITAAGIAKVQDSCTEPSAGQVPVQSSTRKAQTFSPSSAYTLYFVDLPGTNLGGTTTLHIMPTVSGQPSGADLATVAITAGTRFVLASPLPLNQATVYALVLSNAGGNYTWSYSNNALCYANPVGYPFTSLNNGSSWSIDVVDFNFMLDDSAAPPSPTATPTATPAPPSNPVTKPVVFVISLPFGTPTYDPQQLTDTLISKLEEGSKYHGYADPTGRPYVGFQIYGGAIVRASTYPPQLPNGTYDMQWIYDQYNLCGLAQAGAIDEVWVWEAGQGGLPEWVTNGPEWSQTSGYNVPNCGKQLTTLVFNYNREIALALHSFGHRLEGMSMHYFPCDLFTATWPWTGWPPQCAGLVSDRFGFVARPSVNNSYVAVCGDVHHPPNITDAHEYDYWNTTIVQSICEDWSQDGTSVVQSLNCQKWNCTEEGYQIWWMQNLPGYHNTNRDRMGKPMQNWWAYLFGTPKPPVDLPTDTPTATVTGTLTNTPTATPTVTALPPTATPNSVASATALPTSTPTHLPIYLPLVVR
jgi:hypothetical protein